jgi:chromosome segregation ATPase
MGATGSYNCFDRCDKWTLSDQAVQEKIASLERKYTTIETNYNTLHTKYSTLEMKHEQLNKKVIALAAEHEALTIQLEAVNKKASSMYFSQDEIGDNDMVILQMPNA